MHITSLLTIEMPPRTISVAGDELAFAANANALCDQLMDATPGDLIAYHLGFLARDRDKLLSRLQQERRLELHALASYAMRLAEAGWLHLLQRRVGQSQFVYFVVVRPRPRQTRRSCPVLNVDRLLAEVA